MIPDPHSSETRWQPGTLIAGKYELVEGIGSGGMGTVHSARRLSLGDLVAIKSIRPDRSNAKNRARFVREARALARIRHPNVIQVFDYGEASDGRPYMVMEYIDGPTLGQVLGAGSVPLERALEVFADVCMAVEAGHRRGVVHRDLKPANVMLARSDDGSEVVKVLDFGLASLADEDEGLGGDDKAAPHSRSGALVGTCAYMSPETIEQGGAGPASDLFSLGVMLYEIVTGRKPFQGANAIGTIMAICEGSYAPPDEFVDPLPAAVKTAITVALQRNVSARPASAAALAAMVLGRDLTPATNLSTMSLAPVAPPDAGSSRGSSSSSHPLPRPAPSADETEQVPRPEPIAPARPPQPEGPAPGLPSSEQTVDGDSQLRAAYTSSSQATERAASSSEFSDPRTHTSLTHLSIGHASPGIDGDESLRDTRRLHATLASPPFVGRRLELETLLETFARAQHDELPVAVVLGEAGMGRTHLLRQFGSLLAKRDAVVLEGRFWGYESERSPAGETFARMLGAERDATTLDPGVDRRSSFANLAQRFEACAQGRSLVLLLDDLQLAPRRDLEFLTYLIRSGQRTVPMVIVASARSAPARSDAQTELSRWLLQISGLKARTLMTLSGLSDDELRSWLESAFGRLRIRPRDLRRLSRACAGNPYFLAELVRHLVARESLRRDEAEGTWICEPLARDMLPEGVRSAISGQLSQLDPALRALLETACVIGEHLRLEILERAVGLDEDQLDALLDAAIAGDLLVEQDPESGADLRFRSATVQQVIYERLNNRRRRRLHRAVVDALVDAGGSVGFAKVLAWHYRAIADWPQTLRWGLLAAREALTFHDHDAAELGLEHAGVALVKLTPRVVSARDQLRITALSGALHARVGRYIDGETRLREARELLARYADTLDESEPGPDGARPLPYLRFEIALSLARCQLGAGKLEDSTQTGREALELALGLDPARVGGSARRLEAEWDARVALGHTLGRFGQWDQALAILSPVVEAVPLPELRVLHVLGLRERGWIAARRGELSEAEAFAARARAQAKACAEPLAEYCAASVSAVACSARGDARVAIQYYREALRRARALSLRRREMIEEANLAMSLADQGTLDEALKHMLSVRSICEELGDLASAGDACVGLGKVLAKRGDLDQAIVSFRRGHEACEAQGRLEYAAIALLELGRCERRRTRWDAAREVLMLARDRFASIGSLHQWEVEFELALAARGLGDTAQAFAHANAAQTQLEERRDQGGTQIRARADDGLAQIASFVAQLDAKSSAGSPEPLS